MPISTIAAGTARRSDLNTNFAACLTKDTAQTVTVTHTWSASQTFTGGWTAGAACTISTGGLTLTSGDLTLSAGSVTATGLVASGAAPTVTSGKIAWGGTTQGTIGANGSASALTANPQGYILVNVAGASKIVPYYNP